MRVFILIGCLAATAFAGTEDRVLVIGDSWSQLMTEDGSLQQIFADNGRADLIVNWQTTAIGGTTAEGWASSEGKRLITQALNESSNLLVAQLTMGGNDFLAGIADGGWFQGMSTADETLLFKQIVANTSEVVDHIHTARPNLAILISLYDYLNLIDQPCDSVTANLGNPTPEQLNSAMSRLENAVAQFAQNRANVSFVSHAGLMQEVFGYANGGIEPGDVKRPGDPALPSAASVMADCIHLTTEGYRVLSQNLWDNFYGNLESITSQFGERWIPHVTRTDGGFSTTITARNNGLVNGEITLLAYDANGVALANPTLQLTPGQFIRVPSTTLFLGEVSHITIGGTENIVVTVDYAANNDGAPAHVNEQRQSSTRWLFYPGDPDLVFDGLAIVNIGEQSTFVDLVLVNEDGAEIGTARINSALGPRNKQLAVLSDWIPKTAGGAIMVRGTQPLQVIALRGSLAGASPAYLYQTVPVVLPD